jgi:hypothetical protein
VNAGGGKAHENPSPDEKPASEFRTMGRLCFPDTVSGSATSNRRTRLHSVTSR